jgi:Dockerin type I domain
MKVSSVLTLVILFVILLSPHSLLAFSDTAKVHIIMPEYYSDPYDSSVTAEVWVQSNANVKALSLGFAVNQRIVSIETAYLMPLFDVEDISGFAGFGNDSVLINDDTLTLFYLGMITYTEPTLFQPNELVLIGECRWRIKLDSFHIPDWHSSEIFFDSTFIPPALDFIFVNGDGVTITNIIFESDTTFLLRILVEDICGDVDHNSDVDVNDAICLINYLFISGEISSPQSVAEVNCDRKTNINDIVWIINYIYCDGPAPCDCH